MKPSDAILRTLSIPVWKFWAAIRLAAKAIRKEWRRQSLERKWRKRS